MKKLIILLVVLAMVAVFSPAMAQAQQWTTANQITVTWDPVTVATGTVTYKTYTRPEKDPMATLIGTVTPTQATITFSAEGRYFVGVRSVRNVDGIEIEASSISWSDDALACLNGVTFGVQYYALPANVGGIRINK